MSYINYISINLEKYVNMIKLSSTWVKKKNALLTILLPNYGFIFFFPSSAKSLERVVYSHNNQTSTLTTLQNDLTTTQSEFLPKSSISWFQNPLDVFTTYLIWPSGIIAKCWPLAPSLSTHLFASVVPSSSDFLTTFTIFQCHCHPNQSHSLEMDSLIYIPISVSSATL